MAKWVVTHIGRSTVQECVEDRTAYANEAIIHAVHNLMSHLEAFHDSEVDSREAGNLRRIMNHLQGTLIGMEETAALRAQPAPQAEPVAWLIENLILPSVSITTDAEYARMTREDRYEGAETTKVTPLYAAPVDLAAEVEKLEAELRHANFMYKTADNLLTKEMMRNEAEEGPLKNGKKAVKTIVDAMLAMTRMHHEVTGDVLVVEEDRASGKIFTITLDDIKNSEEYLKNSGPFKTYRHTDGSFSIADAGGWLPGKYVREPADQSAEVERLRVEWVNRGFEIQCLSHDKHDLEADAADLQRKLQAAEARVAELEARYVKKVPNPLLSFEDTTHAYECGYENGRIAALTKAREVKPRGECATDGCSGTPEVHFIRGDVGSHYCHKCYLKIHAMEQVRLSALSGEAQG